MKNFSDFRIPPPTNWDDFESLCRRLGQFLWRSQNVQKVGRRGQKQDGVDIVREPGGGRGRAGIQCKSRQSANVLKPDDLDAAVDAARAFQPPLDEFILATTGPRDVNLQRRARELTHSGPFSVTVWSWDDILEQLEDCPEVGRQYCDRLPLNFDDLTLGHAPTCAFSGPWNAPPVDRLFRSLQEAGQSLGVQVRRCEQFEYLTAENRETIRKTMSAAFMVLLASGDVRGQVGYEQHQAIDRSDCTLLVNKDLTDASLQPSAGMPFPDVHPVKYEFSQLYDDKAIHSLLQDVIRRHLERLATWSVETTQRLLGRHERLPGKLIDPVLAVNGERIERSKTPSDDFEDAVFAAWLRSETRGQPIVIVARWGRGKTVLLRRFARWLIRRADGASGLWQACPRLAFYWT